MKVAILVLALFAVASTAPNNDKQQDAEIEKFIKLSQEQGVNAEDFLNKLMEEDMASEQEEDDGDGMALEQGNDSSEQDDEEVEKFLKKFEDMASEQDDDSSEQDDDKDEAVSEEAAEQDNDEENEANIQAAFLAELQKEDEEAATTLQELARLQSPQAKAQWIGTAFKLFKAGKTIYSAFRRRRRRRRSRRRRWWG